MSETLKEGNWVEKLFPEIVSPPSEFLESAALAMILTDCVGNGVDGGDTDSSSEIENRNGLI